MNETPRTDAATISAIPNACDHPQAVHVVPVAIAKQLECEAALNAELLLKADMFDYLCWLEDFCQFRQAALDGKAGDYIVMASDGTTCWGKTYAEAVRVAMEHDKEIHDASECALPPPPESPATAESQQITMSDNPEAGRLLRIEIHAAIRRMGLESEITTYQALGALRVVEHDLLAMMDQREQADAFDDKPIQP